MAFGDNLNDLHMMQVVGHPVAPENARPEILELAKTVIGNHKERSVIAIWRAYNGRYKIDCIGLGRDLADYIKG